MVFTTNIFVFAFLPLSLMFYLLADRLERLGSFGEVLQKIRLKDCILLLFSFIFYMWTNTMNLLKLFIFIGVVYVFALCIDTEKKRERLKRAKIPLTIAVCFTLFCLIYFKYSNFLLGIWNRLFSTEYYLQDIYAPLGISFIVFSAISYLVDIYRGHAKPGSLFDCALFLCFFPKVVSGPIVLWKDFQGQIKNRTTSLDQAVSGLNRIMIGAAKKVMLSDVFGLCIANANAYGVASNMDRVTLFGVMFLYMLQIYYDFSGYSDIAVGLCKLAGFDVKENFNFPYRSKSISEFWRRWHISLGTWFREYIYFPLGGSRKGQLKTVRNLFVIFALTGIWHGAGWNYIIWGMLNGVIVVIEHLVKDKEFYKKIPDTVKWIVTMLIVLVSWEFFRIQSAGDCLQMFKAAFGLVETGTVFYTWKYFFDARLVTFMIIGTVGAVLFGNEKVKMLYEKVTATKTGYFIQELGLLLMFVITILFIVNSTYSPFIYFQY